MPRGSLRYGYAIGRRMIQVNVRLSSAGKPPGRGGGRPVAGSVAPCARRG